MQETKTELPMEMEQTEPEPTVTKTEKQKFSMTIEDGHKVLKSNGMNRHERRARAAQQHTAMRHLVKVIRKKAALAQAQAIVPDTEQTTESVQSPQGPETVPNAD